MMNPFDTMNVKEFELINGCPTFKRIVDSVFLKSPMQKKYLARHFAQRDSTFFIRAEAFAKKFLSYLEKIGLSIDQAAEAYLEVCKDMLTSQMTFKRTQKYSCTSAAEAKGAVYSSSEKMTNYMVGLLLTQYLWPNHYEMYDFFIGEMRKLGPAKKVLEIGPGHGLYFAESVARFPDAHFDAVDISPTSKKLSESLVAHFTGNTQCTVELIDVNELASDRRYDYIVMGEVLEHLDAPKSVLRKIHSLLNTEGYFFITTCANAPAIDHIYLYDSVEHIQRELRECGFEPVSELALPVEDLPKDQWKERKVEVNYAAMLRKV